MIIYIGGKKDERERQKEKETKKAPIEPSRNPNFLENLLSLAPINCYLWHSINRVEVIFFRQSQSSIKIFGWILYVFVWFRVGKVLGFRCNDASIPYSYRVSTQLKLLVCLFCMHFHVGIHNHLQFSLLISSVLGFPLQIGSFNWGFSLS